MNNEHRKKCIICDSASYKLKLITKFFIVGHMQMGQTELLSKIVYLKSSQITVKGYYYFFLVDFEAI